MRVERLGAKAIAGLAMLVLAVTALPGVAGADPTATIQATVRVVQVFEITSSTMLDFGNVKPPAVGEGTVTVFIVSAEPPVFDREATDDALLSGDDNFSPAVFTISGPPDGIYEIFLPLSLAFHDFRSEPIPGVTELKVIVLTSATASVGLGTAGKFDAVTGTDTVFIGGTLVVPDTAKTGDYRGDVVDVIFAQ